MGCSFWNMTFVVSEEARVLSDWAVNYDYNFSVTSCSLSISRRGTWEEQSNLPSLPRSDDPGGFFLDLTQAPSCPGGTVRPAFQQGGFPSLPNEPSAQGTIDHCPRDSTGKPSSLWVCAPTEDKQDKGHVLQSPGVRRHMARSQNSKKQLLISTGLENDHLTTEWWNAVSAYTRLTVSNLSIILKMLKRWAISLVKSLSQVVAILLI